MTIEEIKQLLAYFGAFGVGGIVAGVVVFYLLKSFVPSYLSKKAENLATREDIAKITHEIERVKTQYTILVEEQKVKHQLRLAAIDRRLEAHQEAFTLWRKLLSNTHSENIGNVVIECQSWWEKNCLFLEPEVREAFSDAYTSAHMHRSFLQGGLGQLHLVKENWDRIAKAGQEILKATQLPGLTTAEKKELEELKPK